ncbi:smoothelin isoform X4 [Heliangelus exortis]|uniref:smoothelin isoform X4 n=1 Tax=Heliangelus exortis TaxID=472823 RepID=UPI003A94D1D8
MSLENLLGMDEGALRKLLEATLDLAERRRIRSAIRELQRQELERDEEALASKRFRTERSSHRQEDKENWPRSRHLEEEQKAALAALSQQLEAITDVEELTKLLRAAGEYEERKLIRAAIRKLRAEEIEAATLAENMRSSRRDGSEPPAVPGHAKSSQRDDAETKESRRGDAELPALDGSRESCDEGSSKPLAAARSGEISQKNDSEQLELAGPGESSHGGCVEQSPAQEPKGSVAHQQGNTVEQEHIPAGMQELCSRQVGDLQKPSAQAVVSGTLVLLELQLPSEPGVEPKDGGEEGEKCHSCSSGTAQPKGQPRATWKAGITGSPAISRELTVGQSHTPDQPSSGSQLSTRVCGQMPGLSGRCVELAAVARPTQDTVGTPAHLNTHRWEQTSSSMCLSGSTEQSRAGPLPRAASVRERAQRFSPAAAADGPAGVGGTGGRAGTAQWQRGPRTAPPGPAQNARAGGSGGAEQLPAPVSAGPRPAGSRPGPGPDGMKTFFTIEIKDGRVQPLTPRVVATPSNQRAEVTVGLRSTPIRITTVPKSSSSSSICSISTVSSNVTKMEPEVVEKPKAPRRVVEQPQAPRLEPELPNGMEKVQVRELERRSKLNVEELNRIEDEDVLDKMLDQTTDFEERRLIRNAMRELRQRKRDQRALQQGSLPRAVLRAASPQDAGGLCAPGGGGRHDDHGEEARRQVRLHLRAVPLQPPASSRVAHATERVLEPALPAPLPPPVLRAAGGQESCLPQEGSGGSCRTSTGDGGALILGHPVPLSCWSSPCPGQLQSDPMGEARQALLGVLPSLACLPRCSVFSYLFSSCFSRGQHSCWSVAKQGGAVQPRSQSCPSSVPVSGSPLPSVRKLLCPLQALLGATSLGTAPRPRAGILLSTAHMHPGALQPGGAAALCVGSGGAVMGPRGARGPRREPGQQPPLSSPAQLRAPRAQRCSPLCHRLYTRVDTCINTSQTIKVYSTGW